MATTRKLRIVIVCDSANARDCAERFGTQFAGERFPGCSHEVSSTDFRVLSQPAIRNAAASKAAVAEAVIIATSGAKPLPACVEKWIEMWLWLTDHGRPTIILLTSAENPESERLRATLQKAAASKSLPFISQTYSAPPAAPRLRVPDLLPANDRRPAQRVQPRQSPTHETYAS